MSQVVPHKSHPTSTRGDKISLRESFCKALPWLIFLFACICAASSARADEPTELTQLIRNLSDQIGSKENEPDQVESARSRQRFEVQRSALQAANRSSSSEWNAIQTQADWVRFRDEKLQALLTAQWGYYGSPPDRSAFAMHALVVKHIVFGEYQMTV